MLDYIYTINIGAAFKSYFSTTDDHGEYGESAPNKIHKIFLNNVMMMDVKYGYLNCVSKGRVFLYLLGGIIHIGMV